jgi:ADP-L-glycero-D-manno-heptose 6-epimerase
MSERPLHNDKWIVVTGAAGFIGSCLVRHLNDLGYANLILVDDLGNGEKWKNLVGKRFNELLPISEFPGWMEDKEEDIQAFVHLGGCSCTVESNADFLLENNYRYSVRLAEYALVHRIRFIYASSGATYGAGSEGFSDNQEELPRLRPLNMYGYSKHLFDLWALRQNALNDFVGLKLFNVFGPNEWHKGRMSSQLVRMVDQAQKEGEIRLFKSDDPGHFPDGEQQRDFIYVKDVVRLIVALLKSNVAGIFNVGSGQATTWNELARAVFAALKLPEKITYIDPPADLKGKYQNYTCADLTKLRSYPELGFKATPLRDAVQEYVTEYLLTAERW